jgi:hypothetical protein
MKWICLMVDAASGLHDVWSAAIVALVLTGCPVVDLAFGLLAMLAAPAEFGYRESITPASRVLNSRSFGEVAIE